MVNISPYFLSTRISQARIGKNNFHLRSTLHPSIETTVNSSTYAIPFYQSLGFAVVGEKQNYHGSAVPP